MADLSSLDVRLSHVEAVRFVREPGALASFPEISTTADNSAPSDSASGNAFASATATAAPHSCRRSRAPG